MRAVCKRCAALFIFVWLVSSGGLGCNAHVNKFDAKPRHHCPGQRVDIVWDVTGSADLTFTPRLVGAPAGEVPARGQTSVTPTVDTRVSLHVTRCFGEPTTSAQDIEMPKPVEIVAKLDDSFLCASGVVTLKGRTSGFGAGVNAELVSAKRLVNVTRVDGNGSSVSDTVAPGRPSRSFARLPMNGDWTVSSALGPGESCGNPPHAFTIWVDTTCKAETP